MTDFATLRLDADTSGLVLGVDALKDVQAEAKKTETVVDGAMMGVGRGFKTAGTGANVATAGMASAARAGGMLSGSMRGVSQQLSQVAQMTMATGNFAQALAIQLPDIGIAFGTIGAAAGVLAGIALPAVIAAFSGSGEEAEKAAASAEKLKQAYEDLAASSEDIQLKIDKLRFGVDEEYQVEILKEQLRLRAEYASKVAELNGYLATTSDNIDRQRISTAALRDEIQAIADKYRANEQSLAQQQNRATTLAIIEGERATAAGVIAGRQAQAAAEAERHHRAMVSAYQTYAQTRKEGEELAKAAERAGVAASDLSHIAFGNLATASAEALRLAANLGIALDTAQSLANMGPQGVGGNDPSGKVYSGRGGAPSTSDMTAIRTNAALGGYWTPPDSKKGGGGGAANPYKDDLEALQQNLMSQTALTDKWYQDSLDILNDRRATELLTKQEHTDLLFALDQQYALKKLQLDEATNNSEVEMRERTVGLLANTLNALGQHSKAAAVAAVALNAAKSIKETIQHTAVAVMRAMAELGPIAGPPAAARIKAMGAVQVGLIAANAALSLGGGGGGRGGSVSAIGTSPTTQAPQLPTQTLNFTIENDQFGFGESIIRQIVEQLNKASRNGSNIVATVSA